MKVFAALLLAGSLGMLHAAETVWNGANNFAGIRMKDELSIKDGVLRQNVIGRDSQIIFIGKIDAKRQNSVEIIYRAEGIPKRTSGQIFFAEQGKSIDGKTYWIMPSLQGDGEWHVIRMTASEQTVKNYPAWSGAARPITVIRLDMLDQGPGGFVEIKSVRFFTEEE